MIVWDVFIAHATADEDKARELHAHLEPRFATFLAVKTLPPGVQIDSELEYALDTSALFVILTSAAGQAKGYYQAAETTRAITLMREGKLLVVAIEVDGRAPLALEPLKRLRWDAGLDAIAQGIGEALTEQGRRARASAAVAAMRARTRLAVTDAAIALPSTAGHAAIRLDQVYVARTVEDEIQRHLAGDSHTPLVILGEAGLGKTSLVWRLASVLSDGGREVWLIRASLARHLDRAEFDDALVLASRSAGRIVVIFDTVDLLLGVASEREHLNELVTIALARDARVVLTTRPSHFQLLPGFASDWKSCRLGRFDEKEVVLAIESYAAAAWTYLSAEQRRREQVGLVRAVELGTGLFDVCTYPLTLRMLFDVYRPTGVPPDISVAQLFDRFWNDRVKTDARAGELSVSAADLSRAAGALALRMLVEGRIDLSERMARASVEQVADRGAFDALIARALIEVREQRVEFFHQAIFEHAAARGLLARLGVKAFDLLSRRINSAASTLLLPVIEQLLFLASFEGPQTREAASALHREMMAHPDGMIREAAITAYAQLDHADARVIEKASVAIGNSLVADRLIANLPNVPAPRMREVLGLLAERCRRGFSHDGWRNLQHLLEMLPSVSARGHQNVAAVIAFVDELDLVRHPPTVGDSDEDQKFLRQSVVTLVVALAKVRSPWLDLIALYTDASAWKELRASIIEGAADAQIILAERDVPARLRAALGLRSSSVVEARAWARLFATEWRMVGTPIEAILASEDRRDDEASNVWVRAVAGHLREVSAEEADVVWSTLLEDPDPEQRLKVAGMLWQIALDATMPGFDPARAGIARIAAHIGAAVLRPPEARGVLEERLVGLCSNHRLTMVATSLPSPREHEARWTRVDDWGSILVARAVGGAEDALALLRKIGLDPKQFSAELVERLASQLARLDAPKVALELMLPIALATRDLRPLTRALARADAERDRALVTDARPRLIVRRDAGLASSATSQNELALDLWYHLVRFGLVETVTPDAFMRAMTTRYVATRIGHLRLIASACATQRERLLATVVEHARASVNLQEREAAFDALFAWAAEAPLGKAAEAVLDLATELPSTLGRLRAAARLATVVARDDPKRASRDLGRLFASDVMVTVASQVARIIRSTFRQPARVWLRGLDRAEREAALDLLHRLPWPIGCLLVESASKEGFVELEPRLRSFKDDPKIEDEVRQSIGRQFLRRVTPERGEAWLDLERALAEHAAEGAR